MSGWIKFEKDLKDDPRVRRMARALRAADVTQERYTGSVTSISGAFGDGVYVAIVLGGLAQLWCYADTHVRDDDTIETTADDIDEIVGIKGFAQILPENWFVILDGETVKLPSFHGHNGTDAKKKALASKRVAKHREKVALESFKVESDCNAQALHGNALHALPDQDQDQTKTIHTERARESEISQHMQAIRDRYPPGAGRADWISAEKHARQLVLNAEATWQQLIDGTQRYRQLCEATSRLVLNPARFFGDQDRPCLQAMPLPATKPAGKAPAPNHDAAWAEAKARAAAIGFRAPWPAETPASYMTAMTNAQNAPAARTLKVGALTDKLRTVS